MAMILDVYLPLCTCIQLLAQTKPADEEKIVPGKTNWMPLSKPIYT